MAKLTRQERSAISKKAWANRRPKAHCQYCSRPIWARGVKVNNTPLHKVCAELKFAGYRRKELIKNPDKRAPHNAFRYFGAKELNPKYQFGPPGFRPPSKWFAKMSQGVSASYFGKRVKDLTQAESAKLGQIVGGIWAKYKPYTRMQILKKYEPSAVRINPKKKEVIAHFSQTSSGLFSGVIRDETGFVESATLASTVNEIKKWAKEHGATVLILDKNPEPSAVRANPGAAYHEEKMKLAKSLSDDPDMPKSGRDFYSGMSSAHKESIGTSRSRGMLNPKLFRKGGKPTRCRTCGTPTYVYPGVTTHCINCDRKVS